MLAFFIALAVVGVVVAVGGWFLLGFSLGGSHWHTEMIRTQVEAASARRQIHDLTRQAFVAMAEHAQRRGPDLRAGL